MFQKLKTTETYDQEFIKHFKNTLEITKLEEILTTYIQIQTVCSLHFQASKKPQGTLPGVHKTTATNPSILKYKT